MYIQYFFLCPPAGLCIFVVSWIVVDMYLDDVILPGQGREWRVESVSWSLVSGMPGPVPIVHITPGN